MDMRYVHWAEGIVKAEEENKRYLSDLIRATTTYSSNAFRLVHARSDAAMANFCIEENIIYTGLVNAIYVAYCKLFKKHFGCGLHIEAGDLDSGLKLPEEVVSCQY